MRGAASSLTELYESYLPIAMEAGIAPIDFWDMTLSEILSYMEGYKKRVQWQAMQTYLIGELFGKSLGASFGNDRFPSLQEVFPSLFDDIPQLEQKQPWQIMQERIFTHKDDYKRNQGDAD